MWSGHCSGDEGRSACPKKVGTGRDLRFAKMHAEIAWRGARLITRRKEWICYFFLRLLTPGT